MFFDSDQIFSSLSEITGIHMFSSLAVLCSLYLFYPVYIVFLCVLFQQSDMRW